MNKPPVIEIYNSQYHADANNGALGFTTEYWISITLIEDSIPLYPTIKNVLDEEACVYSVRKTDKIVVFKISIAEYLMEQLNDIFKRLDVVCPDAIVLDTREARRSAMWVPGNGMVASFKY